MDNALFELFDQLSDDLTKVENKHNVGDDSKDAIPEYEVVAGLDYKEKVEGNDQTEDESAKIAALNDRFRKSSSAELGEWRIGDDVNALPAPTKAAIKRKVAEFDDFEDCPLHDSGIFPHISKNKVHSVVWVIQVYADDTMTTLSDHPEDPARSYRVIAVTLSDDNQEAG